MELMDYLHQRNKFIEPGDPRRPRPDHPRFEHAQKGRPRSVARNQGRSRFEKNPRGGLHHLDGGHWTLPRAYELGANSFISKPAAFKSLVRRHEGHSANIGSRSCVLPVKALNVV